MSVTEFSSSLDIANRALQIAGAARITSWTDDSRERAETQFVYDKLRQSELRANVWKFATRRTALRAIDTNSLVLAPPAWSAAVYYQYSAVVSYGGLIWWNVISLNYGNTPGEDDGWEPYFGSLVASSFVSTTQYFASEIVYESPTPLNPDFYNTYIATANLGTTDPVATPTYDATVTYAQGDTVSYAGDRWLSMVSNNTGNTPIATYSLWAVGTTYAAAANAVDPATGRIYTSAQNGNIGHPPASDDGTYWTVKATSPVFSAWVLWTGSPNQALGWQTIPRGATLLPPKLRYPIMSGPVSDTRTRNVFMLPNGFLRKAPQNPLPGAIGWVGGPLGNLPEDWEFENNCFVSSETGPIIFRFVADIVDVGLMDPMFCEALAARIAIAVIPILTQAESKLADAGAQYREMISRARLTNGIEVGPEEIAQDDYITVRM